MMAGSCLCGGGRAKWPESSTNSASIPGSLQTYWLFTLMRFCIKYAVPRIGGIKRCVTPAAVVASEGDALRCA